MSLHLGARAFQIFGAGTDVGKTVWTTILLRAAARADHFPLYIKPVSTGPIDQSDEVHIRKFALKNTPDRAKCLFRLKDPVSPFFAARLAETRGERIPLDLEAVVSLTMALEEVANEHAAKEETATVLVETAGGVLSPMFSGDLQADVYRVLRLPVILICDPKLGGISNTISAYESLTIRGYDVVAAFLLADSVYNNQLTLKEYFSSRVPVFGTVPAPPTRSSDPVEDDAAMESYYSRIDEQLPKIAYDLHVLHVSRIRELYKLAPRAREILWWPFVQHSTIKDDSDVTAIDSAYNDMFNVHNDKSNTCLLPTFDSSASWWTQTFGHAQTTDLTLAAAHAAGRYGHVIYPKVAHEPAINLAEKLLKFPGAQWANRVFYSDNGSTGMEVALKMAMRVTAKSLVASENAASDAPHNWGIIGLKGSYHGDTIGAMNATQRGPFSCEWHEEKGFWFDPPTISFVDGHSVVRTADGNVLQRFSSMDEAYDVSNRMDTDLAEGYKTFITTVLRERVRAGQVFGAVVIEPMLMGAGGMKFVDPVFQRVLVDTARQMSALLLPQPSRDGASIPVVYDEVFSGMGRLGVFSCTGSETGPGVTPDIAVYAKMLTGGTMPLAATLATEEVFNAFLGEHKTDALNHGHSYTASPIACSIASRSIDEIDKALNKPAGLVHLSRKMWKSEVNSDLWSVWNPHFVKMVSECDNVDDVMAMGTVLSIRLKEGTAEGYTSASADTFFNPLRTTIDNGWVLHMRTLGNVAYFMTSLNSGAWTVRGIEASILKSWGKKPTWESNKWARLHDEEKSTP